MPPRNDRRPWIKLFVDECLRGTIREDLTAEERGIWYDFLILAGANRVRGRISANETQAYTTARVAAILNVKENVISRCIVKFLAQGRIAVDEAGIIDITNWDGYQYSSYDRQKPYRQGLPAAQTADAGSNKPPEPGEVPF